MTPTGSFPFFARTTRGLEDVTADELRAVQGVSVSSVQHRMVSGEAHAAQVALAALRTADDVFVEVAVVEGVERPRAVLALLAERAADVDLWPALAVLGALRPLPALPALYVRASFVGRRNYTTPEIEEAVAAPILARHRLARTDDDRQAPLHLRVAIEGDRARLGLRLTAVPLHERAWKRAHRPGSLKPSVAAALWRLAALAPGARALDPCCGGGTLVAEAASSGARALGGDAASEALRASAENLHAAGLGASILRWDARRLPLASACVDAAASNLPWGRQTGSVGTLSDLHAGVLVELARVLRPGARAALLTDRPELLAGGMLREEGRREIGLFGQRPTLVVLAREACAA